MKDCQKQIGTKDCGLFAIATATTLASSRDIKHTCNVTYNQSTMRGQLSSLLFLLQILVQVHLWKSTAIHNNVNIAYMKCLFQTQ